MEDIKISRRSFLKLTALAAAALGSGYAAGRMVPLAGEKTLALHAFLPGDSSLVAEVVRVFINKAGPTGRVTVSADPKWSETIGAAVQQPGKMLSGGLLAFRMIALTAAVPADILLGDHQQAVYAPESDYDPALRSLQAQVRGNQADYLFSAEYKDEGLLAGLWKSDKKVAVIRSGSNLVDRIPLSGNYHDIVIDGPQGKTVLSVLNGAVQVKAAACRHQLCMHSGPAADMGSVIACAPNHLVVQVEAG